MQPFLQVGTAARRVWPLLPAQAPAANLWTALPGKCFCVYVIAIVFFERWRLYSCSVFAEFWFLSLALLAVIFFAGQRVRQDRKKY